MFERVFEIILLHEYLYKVFGRAYKHNLLYTNILFLAYFYKLHGIAFRK